MQKRQQTIFFGNGLNRLSPNCPSWDALLASINTNTQRCTDFEKIPFTFQYEVLLPDDYYTPKSVIARSGTVERTYSVMDNAEKLVKERICQKLGAMQPHPLYERLAALNTNNYITTNYDYQLQNTFLRQHDYRIEEFKAEKRYSIRRRKCLWEGQKRICNIWQIHGEMNYPNSMMLGLDHYCESIGKIDAYIKGIYEGMHPGRDSIEKRLASGNFSDENSWIDLIFYTDVHIIGFGMDYSETDLWLMLNRRMRLLRKFGDKIIPNNIYYYGQLAPDKAHLLQKFGVIHFENDLLNDDYSAQYDFIFRLIEKVVNFPPL